MVEIKFRVRRGNKETLPDLADGELGYARDTRELFVGTETMENVQVAMAEDIDAKVAQGVDSHRAEGEAHSVTQILGAETPAGAQAKVDAHAIKVNNPHGVTVLQIGAETPTGAQVKVDAHSSAAMSHDVSQIAGAVSQTDLVEAYYGKTVADSRFMAKGMSPMVAAIIFGG